MKKRVEYLGALLVGTVLGADLGVFVALLGGSLLLAVGFAALVVVGFVLGVGAVAFLLKNRDDLPEHRRIWAELSGATVGSGLALLAGLAMMRWEENTDYFVVLGNGALAGAFLAFVTYLADKLYQEYQEYSTIKNAEAAVKEADRLAALEQFTDAEDKLKEAVLALEFIYGSSHPAPAELTVKLAEIFRKGGEPQKAAMMYRRALGIYERALGPRDEKVANCIIAMAQNDPDLDPDDTLLLLRRALSIREQQLGGTHPQVADVLTMIGVIHIKRERWADAEEALRRALTLSEKHLPEDHPHRLTRSSRLASTLLKLGRTSEAERILKRVGELRKNKRMPPDEETIASSIAYGHFLKQNNREAEALKIWVEALTALREDVGPQSPSTKALLDLTLPYLTQDWPPGSEELLRTTVAGESFPLRKALEAHPEVARKRDKSGWTPLQWAIFLNQERSIETLFQAGADPDPSDAGDWTPLQIAARWGNRRVLQLLFNKNVDVNRAGPSGYTALHRAALAGDDVIVQNLLNKEADPNLTTTGEGNTPLHLASKLGYPRVVVELVASRADLATVEKSTGRTALHMAAQGGHRAIVDCLILNNPNLAAMQDRGGKTAADLARLAGHTALADEIAKQMPQPVKA